MADREIWKGNLPWPFSEATETDKAAYRAIAELPAGKIRDKKLRKLTDQVMSRVVAKCPPGNALGLPASPTARPTGRK